MNSTMAQQYKRICIQKAPQSTMLEDIKNMFEFRLSLLENKMDLLITTCTSILNSSEKMNARNQSPKHECCSSVLLKKLAQFEELIKNISSAVEGKSCKTCNKDSIVSKTMLLPPGSNVINSGASESNVQIITLNDEQDHPSGSWLGDENNSLARVRVNLPSRVLLHVNEHCTTPEKMALTLLDYLFPREVLAVSNLSGKGKHCKQQLDPLLVFGIRCHLKHKFNIAEHDWYRIKQNIDSKCRTIWKRKEKGLSLGGYKFNNLMREGNSDPNEYDSAEEHPVICFKVKNESIGADVSITSDQSPNQTDKHLQNDFQELLPSVELFTVEDKDYFTLQNHQLTIIHETPFKNEEDNAEKSVLLLSKKSE